MKKLLLSGGVIGLFLIYGLHQQEEAKGAQVIPPQPQSNANNTQTLPSTQSDTGSSSQSTSTSRQSQSSGSSNPPAQQGKYKDGTYTGSVADAFYGNIQVQVTISSGKISDVQFLQYPNDRNTSIMINQQAMPYLKQEAIQSQSANVDIVSGATDSSQAFIQSMQSALAQAH